MAKILIFGTSSIGGVPEEIVGWLRAYLSQGHEFIVGDKKGLDCALHRALSSVGAIDKSTIYCMDKPNNNLYDLKTKCFKTYYDETNKRVIITDESQDAEEFVIDDVEKEMDIPLNRQWYEYRDRQMIDDCDMAICLYGGENKTVMHMIQLLNIKNKPCHCVTIE